MFHPNYNFDSCGYQRYFSTNEQKDSMSTKKVDDTNKSVQESNPETKNGENEKKPAMKDNWENNPYFVYYDR